MPARPEGVYADRRGQWYFKVSLGKDGLTGRREQITRRGYATASEAAKARRELTGAGRSPLLRRRSVSRPFAREVDFRELLASNGLRVTAALTEAGGLVDSPAGRAAYAKYLAWQATEGPAGKNAAYVAMSRGWALGGDDFKANLQAEHDLPASSQSWDAASRLSTTTVLPH